MVANPPYLVAVQRDTRLWICQNRPRRTVVQRFAGIRRGYTDSFSWEHGSCLFRKMPYYSSSFPRLLQEVVSKEPCRQVFSRPSWDSAPSLWLLERGAKSPSWISNSSRTEIVEPTRLEKSRTFLVIEFHNSHTPRCKVVASMRKSLFKCEDASCMHMHRHDEERQSSSLTADMLQQSCES